MREIKFRVYDKRLKSMHIVGTDSHDSLTCFDGIVEYYNLQNGEGSGESGDYILMQYTGLKDKNGNEIYEGDIIEAKHKKNSDSRVLRYKVFFNEKGYWDAESIDEEKPYRMCYAGFPTCEVIGNIYENPELLKGDAS